MHLFNQQFERFSIISWQFIILISFSVFSAGTPAGDQYDLQIHNKTLLIDSPIQISGNITVDKSSTLAFYRGGMLEIVGEGTLTINGGIDAGLFQIFSGDITQIDGLPRIAECYPEWFGTDGEDDFQAIEAAMKFHHTLRLSQMYEVSSTIAIDDTHRYLRIYGGGRSKTGFITTDNFTGDYLLNAEYPNGAYCQFQGFQFKIGAVIENPNFIVAKFHCAELSYLRDMSFSCGSGIAGNTTIKSFLHCELGPYEVVNLNIGYGVTGITLTAPAIYIEAGAGFYGGTWNIHIPNQGGDQPQYPPKPLIELQSGAFAVLECLQIEDCPGNNVPAIRLVPRTHGMVHFRNSRLRGRGDVGGDLYGIEIDASRALSGTEPYSQHACYELTNITWYDPSLSEDKLFNLPLKLIIKNYEYEYDESYFGVNKVKGVHQFNAVEQLFIWSKSDEGNFRNIYPTKIGVGTRDPVNEMTIEGSANISGKLGIGIEEPEYDLDIKKGDWSNNTKLRVGNSSRGLIVESKGINERVTLKSKGTSEPLYISAGNSDDGNVLIATEGGNVGIGKSDPSKKLHVNGDAKIKGNTTIDGNTYIDTDQGNKALYVTRYGSTTQGVKVYANDRNLYMKYIEDSGEPSPGKWHFVNEKAGGPSYEFLTADGGGKVGIGTSSPNEKLDVQGAIEFSSENVKMSAGTDDPYSGVIGTNGDIYVYIKPTGKANLYIFSDGDWVPFLQPVTGTQ